MKLLCKFPSFRPSKKDEIINLYSDLAQNLPTQFVTDTTTVGKIAACNSGINEYPLEWDVLILVSDDMIPQVKGWDQIILDDMAKYYPDTDGVLWYNDGYDHLKLKQFGKNINTLSIMGRKYYERFKYIYNPEYISLFADDEFQRVADMLGKQTYIDRCIIRHEHPFWTKRPEDALYRKNNAYYLQDKAIFEARKLKNFDLPVVETIK